ncbi:3-isopropylmalate dehydratase large subunit [Pseudomonas bharatica]|uniref:3-isopropylmalate dehydratase large subunit n=1 Tax=Pseudomonas bharatica TaxID=2692112 RepID=UPI003B286205
MRDESAVTPARTLFQKIWDDHLIERRPDGSCLLAIDRHIVNEGSSVQAFVGLMAQGRKVRHPGNILAVADHVTPTLTSLRHDPPERAKRMMEQLERNAAFHGIPYIPFLDERQGICHVIAPEQGFSLPGTTLVCGDSHTSTLGAFGSLAFGIGTSEVEHVLASSTVVQWPAKTYRVVLTGRLTPGVTAKDCILALIGHIGTAGATGHVIEYVGEAVSAMSMEQRMTLCNMSIEAGARAGMVAPDHKTLAYLKGRPLAPQGRHWQQAAAWWRSLASDEDAVFDREFTLDVSQLAPQVTWGTSPQDVSPVDGYVPSHSRAEGQETPAFERALDYMGLSPGMAITDIAVDQVFIGSCTNARLSDLREAAQVIAGRHVAQGVRAMVVPGSGLVKKAAEAEGLDRLFIAAGFEWRGPGCSLCCGGADRVDAVLRIASTSNRNFENRQGRGARTHLVSPAMAAAAALFGHFVDIRHLDREHE